MSHSLEPYTSPLPLPGIVLRQQADGVPSIGELENLQKELVDLRQKALARAKKADNDLKAIEAAFRRMRELEKGKAKAFPKVKREPSCESCYNCRSQRV